MISFYRKVKTSSGVKYQLLGLTIFAVEDKNFLIRKWLLGLRIYKKFKFKEYVNETLKQLESRESDVFVDTVEKLISEHSDVHHANCHSYISLLDDNYLYHEWITQRDNSFYSYLQNLLSSNYLNMSSQALLISISTLLEMKSYSQASFLLTYYLERHNKVDIAKYPLVAHFAKSFIESVDETILLSSQFYETVTIDSTKENFENLFSHKKIAVVGNAPTEKGKENKVEIESHDCVIRFNDFDPSVDIEAYGSKVNILSLANNVKSNAKMNVNELVVIFIESDILHQEFSPDYIRYLLNLKNTYGILLMSFDFEFRKSLRSNTKLLYPSSGFSVIYYLLSSEYFYEKISFYGFSFNQPEKIIENHSNRYWESRKMDYLIWHNYERESEIIINLLNT